MKKRTEENRRNLDMIAPTWTLLGLALAACGGGGSGSSGARPSVISFTRDPLTGERSAVVTEANQIRSFESLTPDDIYALYDSVPLPAGVTEDQVAYEIDVTGAKTATVTVMIEGHTPGTVDVEITGPDVAAISFFDADPNAGIRATHAFDWENPLDANRDNVYEVHLEITTTDDRVPNDLQNIVEVYRVAVRNNPADDRPSAPSTSIAVPLDASTGDATTAESGQIVRFGTFNDIFAGGVDGLDIRGLFGRSSTIDSGDVTLGDVEVNSPRTATATVTIAGADGAECVVTITGADAEYFRLVQGQNGAVSVEATQAFDYENSQDADGDNTYDATITVTTTDERVPVGQRTKTQDIALTITDVPNDDRPAVTPTVTPRSSTDRIIDPDVYFFPSRDRSATIIETNDGQDIYAIQGPTEMNHSLTVGGSFKSVFYSIGPFQTISTVLITGEDAEEFAFVSRGRDVALRLRHVDYELPQDADKDNTYEITFEVYDDFISPINLVDTIDYAVLVIDDPNLGPTLSTGRPAPPAVPARQFVELDPTINGESHIEVPSLDVV